MTWDVVFFDFDGVIADSADIKTRAFAYMFKKYGPDVEEKVVKYHLTHEGLSRFEKFDYFYKNILGEDITEDELKILGETFSKLVLCNVIDSPFIAGAVETIHHLKTLCIPAYVVSGTPYDEINHIIREKGLVDFFKGVYGSPAQKYEIINDILKNNCYESNKCLLIGDAISDYKAAQKTGIRFLGIVKKNKKSPFPPGTNISSIVTHKP